MTDIYTDTAHRLIVKTTASMPDSHTSNHDDAAVHLLASFSSVAVSNEVMPASHCSSLQGQNIYQFTGST